MVVGNLISFVALLYLMNAIIGWLGEGVGVPGISFQVGYFGFLLGFLTYLKVNR